MGPAPRDPAAPVPGHPDRQRRGAARGDDRRARVGEPESGVVPGRVAHPAVHTPRRRRPVAGPARLGEQRPDDLFLLRGRAGGPARVRPGRAARAQPPGHAGAGGPRRDDRADRHLPGLQRGPAVVYLALGIVAWAAFLRSGVDPVVVGLVMGLFTQAYPAARGDLELATERFRLFREQPTPELARVASITLSASISPNERLQE